MSCICLPRMEKKSLRVKRVRDPLILISRKNKAVRLKNVTRDDLTCFMEGETPVNTERSAAEAVKIFDEWRKAQIETVTTDLCPENVFTHEDSSIICQWLFKFITEVRKMTGYCMLCCIMNYLHVVCCKYYF